MSERAYHPAADLFPLMEGDEYQALVADIRGKGLLEPIWVMPDGSILDGRNRYRACRDAGVDPIIRTYRGDDPIGFALSQNLTRRHLTASQRAMLALDVLPLREAEAAARRAAALKNSNRNRGKPRGGNNSTSGREPESPTSDDDEHPPPKARARRKAAEDAKVNDRYVQDAKKIQAKAPDLAKKVRSGAMTLPRAKRIIRDREAENRRVEQAKQEAAALEITSSVDIRHGDFRNVLADVHGIDAIITDPPYPKEYLPLLDDLAAWADKALTPDGVLVILFGQTYLPDVYRRLDGHRPYRWTACYQTPGGGYVSHSARVHCSWKPLLVYGGGPRFGDMFTAKGGDADAKSNHKWGQDYSAFHDIVAAFTKPNQTVCDPFMGSGTTLLAAHAQGRNTIGCDIDIEHVETTRKRLQS